MEKTNSYDAVIIGFGKGGKTLAVALGNAGKKTALIEKSPMMYGGTCVNVGCIPTKFLVHKAKKAGSATDKEKYYESAIQAELSLTEKLRNKNLMKVETAPNVTVITGTAKLLSNTEIEVATYTGTSRYYRRRIYRCRICLYLCRFWKQGNGYPK